MVAPVVYKDVVEQIAADIYSREFKRESNWGSDWVDDGV
jgi:hypothetical protein